MSLSLSSFSKTNLMSAILNANNNTGNIFASNATLKIFPSSVAYPSSPLNTAATAAGHILSYTGLTYSLSGNTIIISAGTTSANASAAGTLTWWAIQSSSVGTNGTLFSDSIGTSGSGSILIVNTLTPTNGQSVSITLNLTLV